MGGLNLKIFYTEYSDELQLQNIIKDILSTAPNMDTPYYETHSNYYETLVVKHLSWEGLL